MVREKPFLFALVCVSAMASCEGNSRSDDDDDHGGRGGDAGSTGAVSTSGGATPRGGSDAGGRAGTSGSNAGGVGGTGGSPEAGFAGEVSGGTAGSATGGTAGSVTGGTTSGGEGPGGDGGSDGDDGGHGPGGDGGAGGQGGGSDGCDAGTLVNILPTAPWYIGQDTAGMAIDRAGRVYIADDNAVYVVTNGVADVFLTRDEASEVTVGPVSGFRDLDIGPDQMLYILTDGDILRTNTPHEVELFRDVRRSVTGAQFASGNLLAVVSPTSIAVTDTFLFYHVTSTAVTVLYDPTDLLSLNNCATQDLSAAYSGVFLYQPGCNGSPLYRGNIDGSGASRIYDTYALPLNVSNFACSARDPKGGFYVLVRDRTNFFEPRLLHLAEDSEGSTGVREIVSTPSLIEAQATSGSTLNFAYCSISAAPDGSVFIQTFSQLWQLCPG